MKRKNFNGIKIPSYKRTFYESKKHKQAAIKVKTGALGNKVAEMKNIEEIKIKLNQESKRK